MGSSKNDFMELVQMRDHFPQLSKKQLISNGKEAAKQILDKGEIEPVKALANAARLKEFINSLESELKSNVHIVETQTENGVEISLSNTGDRLDYEKDEIYKELSEKLKERGELLKLSFKSKGTFYDEEGIEVPKVPIKTPSKEVIKLKF